MDTAALSDRIDAASNRLSDSKLDPKIKLNHAQELRDAIDVYCSGSMYPVFAARVIPILCTILEGTPSFQSISWMQKLRYTCLEILHRLPLSPPDVLRPHASRIFNLMLQILRTDNEDNAVAALKITSDLHRAQAEAVNDKSQALLEFILETLGNLPNVVREVFDEAAASSAPNHGSSTTLTVAQTFSSPRPSSPTTTNNSMELNNPDQTSRSIPKATMSFKVMAECPAIVLTLCTMSKSVMAKHIRTLMNISLKVCSVQVKAQQKAHDEAKAQNRIHCGVAPEIKNRAMYGDFVTVQGKALTLISYLVRQFFKNPTEEVILQIGPLCVRMLRDCPGERSAVRKELLSSIRHIINSASRELFLPSIDDFLHERTLLGDGLTVYEVMRPLAYSMLADLLHHMRLRLNLAQTLRTIDIFTTQLCGEFPGASFQTMSAKLLLGLSEPLAKFEDKAEARYGQIRIIKGIADKFEQMNCQYENVLKNAKQATPPTVDLVAEDHLTLPKTSPEWDEIDIWYAGPIKTAMTREGAIVNADDIKFFFKSILGNLKSLFVSLKDTALVRSPPDPQSTPQNWTDMSTGFTAEEVQVIIKLFHEGIQIFRYYSPNQELLQTGLAAVTNIEATANVYMGAIGRDEKELIEQFTTVFHLLDPATFLELFQRELPFACDLMHEHTGLLHLAQFYLASEATSHAFASALLQYLVDNIDEIGTTDTKRACVLLRLFKLSFMGVTLYSGQNEQCLLPYITKIVTKCMALAKIAPEPLNYWTLLRSLFRGIGGGRFDGLYKDILPHLEILLSTLNNLLAAAQSPVERNMYVELCLTVPARLSNLLPHLSFLMKPLVIALGQDTDLVGQGLRTLELCVDNLTADYLDPIMAPVIDDLMKVLWSHLKPAPYNHLHAHNTLRILGKLGGRNRKFIDGPPKLQYKPYIDDEASFDVTLIGSNKERQFPARIGIDLAISKLREVPRTAIAKKNDAYYKQCSWRFITSQLKLLIGFDSLPQDFEASIKVIAQGLLEGNYDDASDYFEQTDKYRSNEKVHAQEDSAKTLLKACFFATSLPNVGDSAKELLSDLARHFAILELASKAAICKVKAKPFQVERGCGVLSIDTRTFARAVAEMLGEDNEAVRDFVKQIIVEVFEFATILFGSKDLAHNLPFFETLSRRICHNIYEESPNAKTGGVIGVDILVNTLTLPDQWLIDHLKDLTSSLLFVVKDYPQEMSNSTRTHAGEMLYAIARRCSKGATMADLLTHGARLYPLAMPVSLELAHATKEVRQISQNCFAILAESIGVTLKELTAPVRDRILMTIYVKPLRALPFALQIGYLDAVTYFLPLHYSAPSPDVSDPLLRFLLETLILIDCEDHALSSKWEETGTAMNIIKLRVACIKLLNLAMQITSSTAQQHVNLRTRIILVFFKSLYSPAEEVADTAFDALKECLPPQSKIPKEILQQSLRPVFVTLQDPRKINIATLKGLSKLSQVLTNHFRPEIGERLVALLTHFSEEVGIVRTSFRLLEQHPQMRLAAQAIEVFQHLPAATSAMIPRIVTLVTVLEEKLRRALPTLMRPPLIQLLNKYPSEGWQCITAQLHDLRQGRFYRQLLGDLAAAPLRQFALDNFEILSQKLTDEESQKDPTIMVNCIGILSELVKHTPDWLKGQDNVRDKVMAMGARLAERIENKSIRADLRLPAIFALEQDLQISLEYMRVTKDFMFLFQLISQKSSEELQMSELFKRFLYRNVLQDGNLEQWRHIIDRSIDLFATRGLSPQTKYIVLRMFVNPILAMNYQKSFSRQAGEASLVDNSLIEMFHSKIWKNPPPDYLDEFSSPSVDHSRFEMMQMTAFLLKYHVDPTKTGRKEIVKFSWSSMQAFEDSVNKHGSFVLIAIFCAQIECPAMLILQFYTTLLKSGPHDGRTLILQALDILATIFTPKLSTMGDPRFPVPAKTARRTLLEDASNIYQVQTVLHFMVRHPDLFYESRDHFMTTLIPCLSRIVSPPTPSSESRKLAINVLGMIRDWELRRVNSSLDTAMSDGRTSESIARQDSSGSRPQTASASSEYTIHSNLRLACFKFLMQVLCGQAERYPLSTKKPEFNTPKNSQASAAVALAKKAYGMYYDLLELWSDLDVELWPRIIEPSLTSERLEKKEEKFVTVAVNALQVVRYFLNSKSDEWVKENIAYLQKVLDKCLRLDDIDIQDALHNSSEDEPGLGKKVRPLIPRILLAMPKPTLNADDMDIDSKEAEFTQHLNNLIAEQLSAGNLIASFSNLASLGSVFPQYIDEHLNNLMKAQSRLSRDHVVVSENAKALQNGTSRTETPGGPQDPRHIEIETILTLKGVDMLASRMTSLGDQRRPFLSLIATLVEKSADARFADKALALVTSWVFDEQAAFPTLKEKTAVLHKMLVYENRPDGTMLQKFLDLVLRIYEDPEINKTELTVRLEHAFLIGTRAQEVETRNRFMTIFDKSLTKTASARLLYVMASQNWDLLADSFWLSQANQLMLGSFEPGHHVHLHVEDFTVPPITRFLPTASSTAVDDVIVDDNLLNLLAKARRFNNTLLDVRTRDLVEPLAQLQHTDSQAAYSIWVALFPLCWAALSKDDRTELEKGMVSLLTKDFHQRQIDRRPNVVQALLEGIARTEPRFKMPPQPMKFLAKTYDAWYIAMNCFERSALRPIIDTPLVRESNLDCLVETYAGLCEDDLFYGAWRRRCKFIDTNAALSYEQNGMWEQAQTLYGQAQIKARTGVVAFSQGEYMLWEDHWVLCAQKLQQWDVLNDFAKHENFHDLLLESSFRNFDLWSNAEGLDNISSLIKGVSDAPTPRRTFFQAFMTLLKFNERVENTTATEFQRVIDDALQLSVRKWHQLPKDITNAHTYLLHGFQQLVELQDAQQVVHSLHGTTTTNFEAKSNDLKLLLGSWRDRLPNPWDDINIWQDLVTWRQHIFQLINKTYLAVAPQQATNNATASLAYRGYHETAWIINRFAHVARKHDLPEVCTSQLSRIYTLPNIEIQEAFLKLREQAKCHYQNPSELNDGLDVINNTNMNYFVANQKAEFFTLKGMFLSKLNSKEEANDAFGTALYYDIRLGKAWAEWGYYNDNMFKAEPEDWSRATAAVSCYLEAASLYKSAKSRKLLSRVLWLLSVDETPDLRVHKAFEDFKGDCPTWYWITFIPQMLTSLSHREARISQSILVKIAKAYPQALYFLLRTTREDMIAIKRSNDQKLERQRAQRGEIDTKKEPETGDTASQDPVNGTSRPATLTENPNNSTPNLKHEDTNGEIKVEAAAPTQKQPWEYTEDITGTLKTAWPLLALTMETLGDQIQKSFKGPQDDDAYRLIVALLNDALSYVSRTPHAYSHESKLPAATETNIRKFAETVLPQHVRAVFEKDFVSKTTTMLDYIQKLRVWRDRFEDKLDHRPPTMKLESMSQTMSEHRFAKFEDIEVPGQYLEHKDRNLDFVKIDRFVPDVDLVRTVGYSHRRLKIRGTDGKIYPFSVQNPAARHSRREERTMQMFRVFNGALAKSKETRRRGLKFYLPRVIPLAPSVRLVQEDSQLVSLQSIYEEQCRINERDRDEPILYWINKLKTVVELRQQKQTEVSQALRLDTFLAIQAQWAPNDMMLDYFQRTYTNFNDFWLFRRQFSYQYATHAFMNYLLFMTGRYPHKILIERSTGNITGIELVPTMNNKGLLTNAEPVPYRLTPNIQTMMGPIATEGIFTAGMTALARSLSDPSFDLEKHLSIFVRDEIVYYTTAQRLNSSDLNIRELVAKNSELIVKKATTWSAAPNTPSLPANQTVIDSISEAVNPARLSQNEALWMPYL